MDRDRSLEVVVDRYLRAWNEPDGHRRAALLAEAVTEDVVFHGPTGVLRGVGPLLGAVEQAREFLPGASVVRMGPVVDGDEPGFAWEIRGPGGGALADGFDVVDLAVDGRLSRIVVLPGSHNLG